MRTRRSCCAVMWLGHCRDLLILALIRESFILCLYACMEFRLDVLFKRDLISRPCLKSWGYHCSRHQVARLDAECNPFSHQLLGCNLDLCLPHAQCLAWYSIYGSLHSSNLQGTQSGRPTTRWSSHSTMSERRCAARPLAGPILAALHG
jgi:hypothetical protein